MASMAPTVQEDVFINKDFNTRSDGESIVISGMSGLFPQSNNVKELSDILYNKVNPIAADLRYSFTHPEVVKYGGIVPHIEHFDAQFFKVHYHLANSMDPMARKILEQTYQAIYDAGINPEHLSGKKVGVYVGSCYSDSEKNNYYRTTKTSGLGIVGCNKAMFANRISYWLNAKGPSMAIDDACCSSTVALEQAYQAMKRGECEAAIVGGAFLSLLPQSSLQYGRLLRYCADGKTKSFDQHADGCARSEAVNVLFLQKAKDALRIYAEVLHVKSEFIGLVESNNGPRYGFYRNPSMVTTYLKKFYEEANVPPQAIEYVEAMGCAVPEVDKAELETIDEVFCSQKDHPLLVGSVMSNIGYCEAASGISAITKVLLGYHNGELAANLHCDEPRSDVAALRDGRIRLVTENQRFGGTYTAINGMSFSGTNTHVLLHGRCKPRDPSLYKSNIPHLVTISARMDNSVKNVLKYLKSRPINPEELALLHNIHQTNISGHLGRGFTILHTNENQKTVSLCEKAEYVDVARRPLWFVYSGMGSQWAGMGAQLMRIPIFSAAIERCRRVLQPKGIDIVHIITSDDKTIYNNILHSFVGIAAVQIGLTDILRELGLVPDGIIGHSVGELGCAYADGCLTAEEMILSAYSRGLVSLQTPFIRGSMAAVGLGYKQIVEMCPPEIEVACHNGPESSTISGPAEAMNQFVAELTAKGVFAKEVPCSNIAYHSRYIADAGPGLLKYLREVIKTPRERSERWISSSVPQERWGEAIAKYSSAEYHTNNLLNPVLFEETSRLIPSKAVLVEVAPHGLLQAILKRSLPASCVNIALTKRAHPDNVYLLLEAIGTLYIEGYSPRVQALYPQVEFPVSTGTPHLSHLVKWAHGESRHVQLYNSAIRKTAASCNYIISLHDEENSYLRGNIIRGQTLYPLSAALVSVWDTFCMIADVAKKQMSVEFEDVQMYAQPPLDDHQQLRINVALHRASGQFEVLTGSTKVATGKIKQLHKPKAKYYNAKPDMTRRDTMELTAGDVYSLLEERDYSYSDGFRSVMSANSSLNEAHLLWRDNWVTMIDGMLQLNALKHAHDGVSTPSYIRSIFIDIKEHDNIKRNAIGNDKNVSMKFEILEEYNVTRCGGIVINHIQYYNLPPMNVIEMALETKKFISNFHSNIDVFTSLRVFLQIVTENANKEVMNVVGIVNDKDKSSIFNEMRTVIDEYEEIKINYEEMDQSIVSTYNGHLRDFDLIIVRNLSANNDLCHLLDRLLLRDAFVLSEEGNNEFKESSSFYRVVCSHTDGDRRLNIARWHATPERFTSAVYVQTPSDLEVLKSTRASLPPNQKLLVGTSHHALPGLKELVTRWRKDADRNKISLVMANMGNEITHKNPVLCEFSTSDLAFNVIVNGTLGGEYYVPIDDILSSTSNNVTLQSSEIGNIESCAWVEAPEPTRDGIIVSVHYASVNYRDVNKASGGLLFKDNIDNNYGMDFSGQTKTGERVMGIVAGGACSSRVRAVPELLWPVPAHWSLEEAATVPLAYAQAFYCLGIKATLKPNMSILVHGGAGALGQAIIAIALALRCNVFTTVSDKCKKDFLKRIFPELKEENIGNSRDESFGDMVLLGTEGKGCDIIITNGSGDLKNTSFKCCGDYGISIDTTQLQNQDKYSFGLSFLFRSRSLVAADFSSIFTNQNYTEIKKLQMMMSEGIAIGYVRPLTHVTFAPGDVTRAFRLLAASRHRGRVLLRIRDTLLQAKTRLICNPDQCQLVLCDDKTLGFQLAERLVNRGAKKLYLHTKSQLTSYFQVKKRVWQSHGVQVELSSEDLKTENDVFNLLSNALHLGPVDGVFVVADVGKETNETLFISLDIATKTKCPNLRHFVVVNRGSSIAGQNTCMSRDRDQLPATFLTLPELKYDATSSAWYRAAVDATERALRYGRGAIVARRSRSRCTTLLQQIAYLADIIISEDTPTDTTLEELGVEEDKLKNISNYLQIHNNIAITDKEIQSLTIKQIRQCDSMQDKIKTTKGLWNFFSYVDSDELTATTELVFLSTLSIGSLGNDEWDTSRQYLCILPGMEGHYKRFRSLCEGLKLPALVLLPGLDNPHETLHQTAQRYAQILLAKVEVKDNFYLLGYESGVSVALETASILEEQGITGTVFCLGHMPDEFQSELNKQLDEYKTEEELQNAVVRHMFKLMVGDVYTKLDTELQTATTWPQKVEATARSLCGLVPHSAHYARSLIEVALTRIVQARSYQDVVRTKLRSKLVLMRAATTAQLIENSTQQYSQQPVEVYQLQASLAHAATDLRCSAIINQHLHPDILFQFQNENTCDTYLVINDKITL